MINLLLARYVLIYVKLEPMNIIQDLQEDLEERTNIIVERIKASNTHKDNVTSVIIATTLEEIKVILKDNGLPCKVVITDCENIKDKNILLNLIEEEAAKRNVTLLQIYD